MGRLRRSRMHKNNRANSRASRTRARTKDLDQIHEDMSRSNPAEIYQNSDPLELPGQGQFYCIHCARHFISADVLALHKKSGPHKRR